MLVKVFVLGRPGSGKTTVIQHILTLAQQCSYTTFSIDDYSILYHMSQDKKYANFFRTTEYGGFDVLDLSIFDTALETLEQQVRAMDTHTLQGNNIITIEFARNNYAQALSKFSADFLKDAYIFFVDADLDTCIERIHKRMSNPLPSSDHFVSDYIMRTYYNHENWRYMQSHTQSEYDIDKNVQTFCNTGSISDLFTAVDSFTKRLFEADVHQPTYADINAQLLLV